MNNKTNLKCPVCSHHILEQILVAPMLWQKNGYMGEVQAGKAIDTYRCTACHYILLFATDDPIKKRDWKYYIDKNLG